MEMDWLGTLAYACNPSTLGGWGGWITWGGSLRPAWPTWRNPVSTKNTKLAECGGTACNPSYLGGSGRRIAWTQEAKVAVSWDHAIALQRGQWELNSISKKKVGGEIDWRLKYKTWMYETTRKEIAGKMAECKSDVNSVP